MRFLLVEDEPPLQELLVDALRAHGWAADVVSNATEAAGLARAYPYDALIVDVGLPEGREAGFELVSGLRATGLRTPVLFLTARGDHEDRIRGLELGGDDYVVKPAHLGELRARLTALVRRDRPARDQDLRRGALRVLWNERRVTVDEVDVHLTAKEYALLELLASHPGRLFTRDEIIERVWNAAFDSSPKLVDIYVRLLRKKLGEWVVETVRGIGYRFPA